MPHLSFPHRSLRSIFIDAGVPIRNIKLLCVIASMPGLQQIMRELPGLEIFVAAVDQELSKDGYIVPGIGDRCVAVHLRESGHGRGLIPVVLAPHSGDRIFSTV